MMISLDGYDILARIGLNKSAFPGLRREASILAEELLRRELTRPAMTLEAFRAVLKAVGEDAVGLVLETMDAASLTRLAAGVDPNLRIAVSDGLERLRRSILELAAGRRRPRRRASGAAKKPLSRPPAKKARAARKAASPFGTASMGASRRK